MDTQLSLFATTTTLRFSEAMRLGAMMRPQAFFKLHDTDTGGSCALGAVADALGALQASENAYTPDKNFKIPAHWKAIGRHTLCPHCDQHVGTQIDHVIIHLNNDVRWTRERIADWIETVEAAQGLGAPRTADAVARAVDDQLVLTTRA